MRRLVERRFNTGVKNLLTVGGCSKTSTKPMKFSYFLSLHKPYFDNHVRMTRFFKSGTNCQRLWISNKVISLQKLSICVELIYEVFIVTTCPRISRRAKCKLLTRSPFFLYVSELDRYLKRAQIVAAVNHVVRDLVPIQF